ncbi:MAG: CHAD domain-containing protein [Acidimicrobiia bacterium]
MSYRFQEAEDLPAGVRRIAHEQLSHALDDLREMADPEQAVHDARKRCKKLRGLVRLIRPTIGDQYRTSNHTFRDAARLLAPYRDAHALLACFDDLVMTHGHLMPDRSVGSVRDRLKWEADAASLRLRGDTEAVEKAVGLLAQGRDLIERWQVSDRFSDLEGGLKKTYGRGVEAYHTVAGEAGPAGFHEWRKRVKYHWYHVRLLRNTAPALLRRRASRLHDLSDGLGDGHDLHVLAQHVRSWDGMEPVDTRACVVVAGGVRLELERRSIQVGARLFVEKPKRLVQRFSGWWGAWRRWGGEPEVGEMADMWNPTDEVERELSRER